MPISTPAALALAGLSKTFQGQRALDRVDLEVRPGEVHALLGQNGSGKSTLIKILAGYHQPDPGWSALRHGVPFNLGSAQAARAAGLRFIHQDLGLITALDAVDNLALGDRYTGRVWLSDRRERKATRDILAAYGVDVDVTAPLERMSAVQRTLLAIVRAIRRTSDGTTLLVLDEPTASLPNREVQHLFGLIRALRDRGGSILYVTHRLSEVAQISDRVSVLRDGRRVETRDSSSVDHDGLVKMIVGRSVQMFQSTSTGPTRDVVLSARHVGGDAVADISIEARRGEIVGVTGLVGSGYDQILGLVYGARRRTRGTVTIDGAVVRPAAPRESIEAGAVYVPADRKRLASIGEWSLRENLTLPRLPSSGPLRWLSDRSERSAARVWLDRLQVVPSDPERTFAALSGGNQQKVVLARWLRCQAVVLLLDEPTNGIDTAAKQAIYAALSSAAAAGAGIVVSSADTEELCAICHRVLVIREGRIAVELSGPQLTVERLLSESLRDVEHIRPVHGGRQVDDAARPRRSALPLGAPHQRVRGAHVR